MPEAHLAQVNIGTLRQPLDHPDIADFNDGLDPVNALAESSPGYVWRLQTEAGDATALRLFDNPLTIPNLTVWTSIEALREFVYRGLHRDFFRRRAEWFDIAESRTAMWWIPAGSLPTTDDAIARLDFYDTFGATPYAFQMGQSHPQLVIRRTSLDDPHAVELIGQLNAELSAQYPEPGSTFFTLTADHVADGVGGFYVATLDGSPVGCAAYRALDDTNAEVKRMFTTPATRGLKVGAALLNEVQLAARLDGRTRLVLETGTRQTAAAGLYQRFGFQPVPCWGDYANSPLSVCFGKSLTSRRPV